MARMKKFRAPKVTTVVGKNTEIKGDLTFSGGLHVDGTILGNVTGDQDDGSAITVSEAGKIEGDVRVSNVILNGTVVGDVFALQRVELAPMARVTGTVYYCFLEMAMGAEVNGQLVHTEEETLRLGYDSQTVSSTTVDEISSSTGTFGETKAFGDNKS